MCTVAFIPDIEGGYLLGHNRDELRSRAPGLPPRRYERAGSVFLAPRDPDGGGTWFGSNESGVTLCLLNAAENDPDRLPAAPRSRGLLLWDLLDVADTGTTGARLDQVRGLLAEVRAFHLVAAGRGDRGSPAVSEHWIWNGDSLVHERRHGPTLYVSSSFAPEEAERERRTAWRRLLLAHPNPGENDLVAWLASEGEVPGPFTVCMERPNARTVSSTLVRVDQRETRLTYVDGPPCNPASPRQTLHL